MTTQLYVDSSHFLDVYELVERHLSNLQWGWIEIIWAELKYMRFLEITARMNNSGFGIILESCWVRTSMLVPAEIRILKQHFFPPSKFTHVLPFSYNIMQLWSVIWPCHAKMPDNIWKKTGTVKYFNIILTQFQVSLSCHGTGLDIMIIWGPILLCVGLSVCKKSCKKNRESTKQGPRPRMELSCSKCFNPCAFPFLKTSVDQAWILC